MSRINWNYHCHTNYTDGLLTVKEIAKYCDNCGIEEIAVTEHVRRELTYDFGELLSEIDDANERFNVRIISGIEARILPDGSLDCTDDIRNSVRIVVGSVHGLENMTEEEAYAKLAVSDCMVVGHPQYFNEKIIDSMVKTRKIVELSNRYAQSEEMIRAFRDAGLSFSIGLDSHGPGDLNDFGEVEKLIDRLGLWDRLWRYRMY